jgi:hypothetical protein
MKRACPICRTTVRRAENPFFPFCSERCRTLDLGAWASERYRIAAPVFDESQVEDESPTAFPAPEGKSDE